MEFAIPVLPRYTFLSFPLSKRDIIESKVSQINGMRHCLSLFSIVFSRSIKIVTMCEHSCSQLHCSKTRDTVLLFALTSNNVRRTRETAETTNLLFLSTRKHRTVLYFSRSNYFACGSRTFDRPAVLNTGNAD